MNANAILSRVVLAAALTTIAFSAHARGGGVRPVALATPHSMSLSSGVSDDQNSKNDASRADARSASSVSPALGKTREQVRTELLEAGEQGMLPLRWVDYPPSSATRARNRENFLRLEQVWKAEGVIPATSISSTNGSNEEQR
ncbi:DUF4148 domain-containing protein [Paraburkholderia bannensis]|uniref:DUF4148 domain-containing protein n=1 Tax=Paraburkholderia bannensis TaxID=765414 RepID=UPI002ABE1475|nr:DUF4148 domain-containing protein [Paraburkholderia bannensis]